MNMAIDDEMLDRLEDEAMKQQEEQSQIYRESEVETDESFISEEEAPAVAFHETKPIDVSAGQKILKDIRDNDPFGKNRIGWGIFGSILEAFRVMFEYVGMFIRGIVFGTSRPSDIYERVKEQDKTNEYKKAPKATQEHVQQAQEMAGQGRNKNESVHSTELANSDKTERDMKNKKQSPRERSIRTGEISQEKIESIDKQFMDFMKSQFGFEKQQDSELNLQMEVEEKNGESFLSMNCIMNSSVIDFSHLASELIYPSERKNDAKIIDEFAKIFDGINVMDTTTEHNNPEHNSSISSQIKARLMAISLLQQSGVGEHCKDNALKVGYDIYHFDIVGDRKNNGIVAYINPIDKEKKDWSVVSILIKDYSQDPPKSLNIPNVDISTLDKGLLSHDFNKEIMEHLDKSNYSKLITGEEVDAEETNQPNSTQEDYNDTSTSSETETPPQHEEEPYEDELHKDGRDDFGIDDIKIDITDGNDSVETPNVAEPVTEAPEFVGDPAQYFTAFSEEFQQMEEGCNLSEEDIVREEAAKTQTAESQDDYMQGYNVPEHISEQFEEDELPEEQSSNDEWDDEFIPE